MIESNELTCALIGEEDLGLDTNGNSDTLASLRPEGRDVLDATRS